MSECKFHPGGPVFHEGSKSYSCCNTINKPVLSFEEFLAIPGCVTGSHSAEASYVAPVLSDAQEKAKAAGASSVPVPLQPAKTNVETAPKIELPDRPSHHYKMRSKQSVNGDAQQADVSAANPFPVSKDIEQDPVDAQPSEGTQCKRAGCQQAFTASLRREGEECLFHPGSASAVWRYRERFYFPLAYLMFFLQSFTKEARDILAVNRVSWNLTNS